MVGPSKILTVSYGTFSCTLEGFDDPFNTMRSIAEYFRDLAAEDRYFGAEPPTPDAEMLHRIAEREIQRKVEARVSQDGAVVLRQMSGQTPAPAAQPAMAPAMAPVMPTTAPAAPAASVSDKLSRIRAVVNRARDDASDAEYEEDEGAFAPAANPVASAGMAAAFAPVMPAAAEPEMPQAAEPAPSVAESPDAAEATVEPAATEDATPEFEDIEAERLVAEALETPEVVSPQELAEAVEFSEDDTTEEVAARDDAPEDDRFSAAIASVIGSEEAVADEPEASVTETAEADAEDALSDAPWMARAEDDEAFEDETEEARPAVVEMAEEENLFASDEAQDGAHDGARDEADDERRADEDGVEVQSADDQDMSIFEGVEAASGTADETPEEDAPEEDAVVPRPIAARIVKIKRAELAERSAAASQDDMPEEDTAADDEAEDAAVAARRLSDEDEAELMRELAAVSNDAPEAPVTDKADEEAPQPDAGLSDKVAFDRILEETNSKMAETEGSRRRSAIAHLKAAVAATKADRFLKRVRSREVDAAEQSEYRNDLAQVVRPRRPSESGQPTSGQATERPAPLSTDAAPLMLVSELRIDDSARPSSIMPRRISTDDQADEEEATSLKDDEKFMDFAEKMGATELPDLLEAAAAYSAFVEGRKHFSRPQLMQRVAGFDGSADYSREQGLRSFGQLLRQGKIQKLKRGQFTISEDTRFRPESRIAGE